MQSTRAWLASAIEGDGEYLRRGMADWLGADGSLGLDTPALRRLARSVLHDFRAWLRAGRATAPGRARGSLRSERGAGLARSFLLEYLKAEGVFDGLPRGLRGEIHELIDLFFIGAPTGAPTSDPGPNRPVAGRSAPEQP